MPKTKVNGINLYYEVYGQGYPVVLLHGFLDTVDSWQAQIPALSRDYQLIIYDARGHGKSESPLSPDLYSADIVVEDLFELLRTLKIEKAVVGGISMGGYETLRFYMRHPEAVSALIPIDTGPGYHSVARREESNRWSEERIKVLETQGMEAYLTLPAPFTSLYQHPKEDMLKLNPIGLINMSRKVIMQHDSLVIENLSQIKVPSLILVGEKDERFLRAASYMTKIIPGAQCTVIPGAGHLVNQDAPGFFNKVVLDFLGKLNLPKN